MAIFFFAINFSALSYTQENKDLPESLFSKAGENKTHFEIPTSIHFFDFSIVEYCEENDTNNSTQIKTGCVSFSEITYFLNRYEIKNNLKNTSSCNHSFISSPLYLLLKSFRI